ncbi:hypothetical protein BB561_005219 [Smittium simulii]|uniref:Phosphatidate phosphatase APP1 catalytic domain-containing protein n=1 Tax=Smittium simulii TaxID=133385 RepID=A0A2T9YBH4_9FUNG|nr:hypothetical protein BB561_005219 [Smittium simulii]
MNEELPKKFFLFPSFGFRDETIPGWRVQIRGFAYTPQQTSKTDRFLKAVFRTLSGLKVDSDSHTTFQQRLNFLFSDPIIKDTIEIILKPFNKASFSEFIQKPKAPPKPQHLRTFLKASNSLFSTSNTETSAPVNPLDFSYTVLVDQGKIIGQIILRDSDISHMLLSDSQKITRLKVNGNIHSNIPNFLTPNPQNRDTPTDIENILSDINTSANICLVDKLGISVISDIDDTVKELNLKHGKRKLIETVFLNDSKPITAMNSLYSNWHQKYRAEFHYVSNSPCQFYPMIDDFFSAYSFPVSSVHLRDFSKKKVFDKANLTGSLDDKYINIKKIIDTFPEHKYIFVGDSGEKDIELYTKIAIEYPAQVAKIFIRDIYEDDPDHFLSNSLDLENIDLQDLENIDLSSQQHYYSSSSNNPTYNTNTTSRSRYLFQSISEKINSHIITPYFKSSQNSDSVTNSNTEIYVQSQQNTSNTRNISSKSKIESHDLGSFHYPSKNPIGGPSNNSIKHVNSFDSSDFDSDLIDLYNSNDSNNKNHSESANNSEKDKLVRTNENDQNNKVSLEPIIFSEYNLDLLEMIKIHYVDPNCVQVFNFYEKKNNFESPIKNHSTLSNLDLTDNSSINKPYRHLNPSNSFTKLNGTPQNTESEKVSRNIRIARESFWNRAITAINQLPRGTVNFFVNGNDLINYNF